MTQRTPLDVRAGLTPGSLIIKAQKSRSHHVIMVPPADRPCHFQVLPMQPDGFALVRVQQPVWPASLINETLLEFDSQHDADEALHLLEEALVNDGPASNEGPLAHDQGDRMMAGRRIQAAPRAGLLFIVMAILFIISMLVAGDYWRKTEHDSMPSTPAQETAPALATPHAVPPLPAAEKEPSAQTQDVSPAQANAMAPSHEPADGNSGKQGNASAVTTMASEEVSPGDAFVHVAGGRPQS